jgi:hypothetical protein
MIVAAIHFGCGDGFDFFVRQFRRGEAALLRLKAGEGFIFIGGHEIARNVAVAADGHGRFLSKHPVTAKVSCEFSSGNDG